MTEPNAGAHIVFTYAMDLVRATTMLLGLSTQDTDAFHLALVEQLAPHLQSLDLADARLKMTGDGWMLMTADPEAVRGMCCLSLVMAQCFREEMAVRTGIPVSRIPQLKQAICGGRDIHVRLPNGHEDWLGDSARRAARALSLCMPGEVLVCEATRNLVHHDFVVRRLGGAEIEARVRISGEHHEEIFPLCLLVQLKHPRDGKHRAPPSFVYVLTRTGRQDAANRLAGELGSELLKEIGEQDAAGDAAKSTAAELRQLLTAGADAEVASTLLDRLQAAGTEPDAAILTSLVCNASTYSEARRWMLKATDMGIEVALEGLESMARKAKTLQQARQVAKKAAERGQDELSRVLRHALAAVTQYGEAVALADEYALSDAAAEACYSVLAQKAPTFDAAESWAEQILTCGGAVGSVVLDAVGAKAPSYEVGVGWLQRARVPQAETPPGVANHLAALAPSFHLGIQWLRVAAGQGSLHAVSVDHVLELAATYEEARELLLCRAATGVAPVGSVDRALRVRGWHTQAVTEGLLDPVTGVGPARGSDAVSNPSTVAQPKPSS